MLESIEALDALSRAGTMRQAGTMLRVTQSAVSKRIAALEAALGEPVLERHGRRVTLTPAAEALLARARPAIAELRAALEGDAVRAGAASLPVGVSESVLASWGPGALKAASSQVPGVTLTLHAHRSPVVVDRVASGEYALGVVAGAPTNLTKDLSAVELVREPMVLIPRGLDTRAVPRARPLGVITIEARSGTWESLARAARRLGLQPETTLESFFAVAQLAVQGFGHGLVPAGVAAALGIEPKRLVTFPKGALTRPVQLVARRSTLARPLVAAFAEALREACG